MGANCAPVCVECCTGATANRSLSDLVGQSSNERYHLTFEGDEGFVVVQPYEERPQFD